MNKLEALEPEPASCYAMLVFEPSILKRRSRMKKVNEFEIAPAVMKHIQEGAFLTVAAKHQMNVMTIGWALVGILWRKPVLMVAVRNSRHTFGLIEEADSFTVSVPTKGMKKELELWFPRARHPGLPLRMPTAVQERPGPQDDGQDTRRSLSKEGLPHPLLRGDCRLLPG
jgi:hypothetical protein